MLFINIELTHNTKKNKKRQRFDRFLNEIKKKEKKRFDSRRKKTKSIIFKD